jgi:hypothetical protein
VTQLAGNVVMKDTPATLCELWRTWLEQHTDWDSDAFLWVPSYFLFFQRRRISIFRELGRRGRHLQVHRALAGLTAGPAQQDMARLQRFLGAMNTTLKTTVRRELDLTVVPAYKPANKEEAVVPLALAPIVSAAIEGAMAEKIRIEEILLKAFLPGSDQSIEPMFIIPKVSVPGMEDPDGLNDIWRAAANELALSVLAIIAPGHLGWLETALSDAALAAQRYGQEKADAKFRGGSGGRHAKKIGTAVPAAQYVPIVEDDPDPDEAEPDTGCYYIDPPDHRFNPERVSWGPRGSCARFAHRLRHLWAKMAENARKYHERSTVSGHLGVGVS